MKQRRTVEWKIAGCLAAFLAFAGSASAALVITTTNQTGALPFSPAWNLAPNSLLAGLMPSSFAGNFSLEAPGRNVASLTSGGDLTIAQIIGTSGTTASTNYITCGNGAGAGSTLIYTLPASANGYDLTNLTVYSGWQDNGRDAQSWNVSYSTAANPGFFIPLTTVAYNPPVPGGIATANRVTLADSAGGHFAGNVIALKFDFTAASVENGYAGYGAITVQGAASTNVVTPLPIVISTESQSGDSSFVPDWIIETDSLVAGEMPSFTGTGNFQIEPEVAGLSALTDGAFGMTGSAASFATCGDNAGRTIAYYLDGATLTNIVVYSGWVNPDRDGQFYNVFYSTMAAPDTFLPLTSVSYNPVASGNSAARVAITTSSGAPLATNVAFVQFDFTPQNSSLDNGYSGYAEIILEGSGGGSSPQPPAVMQKDFPTSTSDSADAVLVFNEIMYHPAVNEAGMEWIELYNQLAVDIDVSNWRISGDTDFIFPAGTRIGGRSFIVVARDPAQLQAATGLSSNVFGPFISPLDNKGGTLELFNNAGRLMDAVSFGTEGDWPITPDGAGPSLAKLDRDWGSAAAANWRASVQIGGTPGAENFPAAPSAAPVVFNEVSGATNATFWIELKNRGSNTISLGGCILHHDGVVNTDYVFPSNVTLDAGAFLVLSNDVLGFQSPASGEKLFLFGTNYSSAYDGFVLKKTPRARSTDGTGKWFVPSPITPGESNRFAFHTDLVINEIMCHHAAFPVVNTNSAPLDNPEEWIELYNRGTDVIDLAGWEIKGGISYTFSAGISIAPGAFLVIANDAAKLSALYPGADIIGNFSGRLGGDDQITLNDPSGNPADEVHYYTSGHWPESAGGGGSSLELRDPNADNSKAEAWAASDESGKSSWQTCTYQMIAQPSATSAPDNQWRDFVLGILGDGECWVDDIRAVQSPGQNPIDLISNGDFENGLNGWRVLGNHGHSRVESDPVNPGNHVLHVVASGPQEHMHNHIETTLADGRAVTNGLLYEVSFRARWITGNNRLNTRLYFNRVARTTVLETPQLNGTPGSSNSQRVSNLGPTFTQFQHQPVVPRGNQPVTVFVRAADPQNVSACTVWWSVNGGAWSSAPMTATNDVYSGIVPGFPANSLVQFYVSAMDALGAVATYPARGPNSGAFYRVNDGFANLSPAHSFRILMSPANVALQNAFTNLMSNENLPCTVIYDERQVYYDVAVRLKSSERGRVVAARIGFHLEFNPDDLFRGVHPVLLVDRSAGDLSLPGEEMLVKHMLSHAGLPGVNSDFGRIIAPQSAQNGMAILSPRYEDNFIATAFPDGDDGTLYELELTYFPTTADEHSYKLPAPDNVQGVDISDLGDDKERYRYNFLIKNHRAADDYSDFIQFAKSWSLNGTALDQQAQITMDVDEWLNVYAMIGLSGISDMYTFGGNHNLMMYLRPSDGRFLYFPWDMDFAFARGETDPLIGDQNLGKIVNRPANLRRFYAHVLDHIQTTFNAGYMTDWVSHYGSLFGQDYSADLSYIANRASYAISTIANAGGNADFSVNETNLLTVSNNLVTLSGTAPVGITSVVVNGISFPVTWSSISNWTVQVPVNSPTNFLNVQGYDLHGNLVSNISRTVIFDGAAADPARSIVFNEIMFRPTITNAEYVELFNASENFSFDLSGGRINGLGYTFPSGSILRPRSFLVLAKDRAAFATAYGSGVPVFDLFPGSLDSNDETLTLFLPDAAVTNQEIVVNRVRYETGVPWPTITNGAALQLRDAVQDNSRVANWIAVSTNVSPTLEWVHVSATGIPKSSASSRPFYIYLQSAGDIYIDDVTVVAGSVAEAGANLVPNGGFENSIVPWTIGSAGNNIGSTISTTFKHSGNSSLHLIASSGGSTKNSSIWQDFSSSLTVGATYTLSFWYRQTANGGPLTVRFSNNGIAITANPAPSNPTSLPATPGAVNSVTATLPEFPDVWLNELQAQNVTGPTNNFGVRVPWVELHNAGTNALSLAGFYLSATYTNLTQWAFPNDAVIPAHGFLVVWCDEQTGESTAVAPHANFTLAPGAGSIALSRIIDENVPQIVDYLNYSSLPANWSYGDFPDGQPFYRQKMFQVTAGETNSAVAAPITISINEWMADNGHTLANPLGGKFDDWFELYNYGTNIVDLGGYYLTGDLTDKTKFKIPDTHQYLVPPHGFVVVWADNANASNDVARPDLHVNFKLSKSGEAIGLFGADGTMIDAVMFGAQATDVTQGRFPDGALDIFSMPTPTPQTNNIIPNTAPALAAITDKYVHVGQAVQFVATATDAQSASQTLTFSLSNAPTAAVIQPFSGAFLWVTTNAIVPSTNFVTLRVTDNGTPSLSDTKTFAVIVTALPQFSGAHATGDGHVQISFHTLPGQNYQPQYKNHLSDPVWIPLGESISGTGADAILTDDATESSQRFYRLVVLP